MKTPIWQKIVGIVLLILITYLFFKKEYSLFFITTQLLFIIYFATKAYKLKK